VSKLKQHLLSKQQQSPESTGVLFPIPFSALQHSKHLERAANHRALGKPCEKSVYAMQVCKHLPMQCTLRLDCPVVQEKWVSSFNIINYYFILIITKEVLGDYSWVHGARSSQLCVS